MKKNLKMYLIGVEQNTTYATVIKEYSETDFEEYGWFFESIITGKYPSKIEVFKELPQWLPLSEELQSKVGDGAGITMITELDNFKFRNFWKGITKNIKTINEFFNSNPIGINNYMDAFVECQLDYNRSYNKILHDLLGTRFYRSLSILWKYN